MGLFSEDPLPLPGEKPPHRDKERKKRELLERKKLIVWIIIDLYDTLKVALLLKLWCLVAFIYLVWYFVSKLN